MHNDPFAHYRNALMRIRTLAWTALYGDGIISLGTALRQILKITSELGLEGPAQNDEPQSTGPTPPKPA